MKIEIIIVIFLAVTCVIISAFFITVSPPPPPSHTNMTKGVKSSEETKLQKKTGVIRKKINLKQFELKKDSFCVNTRKLLGGAHFKEYLIEFVFSSKEDKKFMPFIQDENWECVMGDICQGGAKVVFDPLKHSKKLKAIYGIGFKILEAENPNRDPSRYLNRVMLVRR